MAAAIGTIAASGSGATSTASTLPARRGAAVEDGAHSATSAGAIT